MKKIDTTRKRLYWGIGILIAMGLIAFLAIYFTSFEGGKKFVNEFLNWEILRESMPELLKGLTVTLRLALLSEACILVLGLIIALIRISRIPTLRILAAIYIDVIRGIPLILQIVIVYFGLAYLGINLSRFVSGVVALTVCYSAYEAEIFRAGIESIHKGQMEAARSLGMGYFKAMRYVILPQAIRNVIPPLSNEFIALVKDTSLVAFIGLSEVFRRGTEMMARHANITPLVGVAICYLMITLPMMRLVQYMDRRMSID